ncbi:DUF1493 family protein [Erwinia sp. Leaf53]|uniref:DUF1493 family protein n=1 Tax=Erwinia sp. Leaf53 TaxID=1736225 RepID=UPI0006F1EA66|nr:DUF1493 family protein [Erwinia sp. Leaf53]KQN64433.1 hypothetical protein ASF13_00700 [Erwinia sp. Leaf53]
MDKGKDESIAQKVLSWYQDYWDVPVFPFFKKVKISKDTSLSSGKYQLAWEDAEDLLVEYFEKFSVEQKDFAFIKYWPNDEVFRPLPFLGRKKYIEPKLLTVEMLMLSAEAGYWLYD